MLSWSYQSSAQPSSTDQPNLLTNCNTLISVCSGPACFFTAASLYLVAFSSPRLPFHCLRIAHPWSVCARLHCIALAACLFAFCIVAVCPYKVCYVTGFQDQIKEALLSAVWLNNMEPWRGAINSTTVRPNTQLAAKNPMEWCWGRAHRHKHNWDQQDDEGTHPNLHKKHTHGRSHIKGRKAATKAPVLSYCGIDSSLAPMFMFRSPQASSKRAQTTQMQSVHIQQVKGRRLATAALHTTTTNTTARHHACARSTQLTKAASNPPARPKQQQVLPNLVWLLLCKKQEARRQKRPAGKPFRSPHATFLVIIAYWYSYGVSITQHKSVSSVAVGAAHLRPTRLPSRHCWLIELNITQRQIDEADDGREYIT